MFLSVGLPSIEKLFVAYSTLFSLHSSSYLLSFPFSLPFPPAFHSLLLSLSFESAAHQSYNLNSVRALLPPQHFCRERENEMIEGRKNINSGRTDGESP